MSDNRGGLGPTLSYESKEPQTPPKPFCPKCGIRMLQGLIAPNASAASAMPCWIEGETKRGWFGIKRMPRGKPYEIMTFRCPGCGLLESYSPTG
jgi:hypothetical protein